MPANVASSLRFISRFVTHFHMFSNAFCRMTKRRLRHSCREMAIFARLITSTRGHIIYNASVVTFKFFPVHSPALL